MANQRVRRVIQHFFKMGKPGLFLFYFRPFLKTMTNTVQIWLQKEWMVSLGLEPGAAEW